MKYAITCDGIDVKKFEHVTNLSPQMKEEIIREFSEYHGLSSSRGLKVVHIIKGEV